jgi:hypothetical protein
MIELLDPVAEPGLAADPYTCRFEPRAGAVIAMVSNSFTDASVFLRDIQAQLVPLFGGVEYRHFDKTHIRHSTYPLTAERIAEIAAQCDAVVTAYGHCGSCTSGTIRDAVAFARTGTPVVALATERFADEARFVARAAGMPQVPLIILPHPVAGRDRQFHEELARKVAPQIVAALTWADPDS